MLNGEPAFVRWATTSSRRGRSVFRLCARRGAESWRRRRDCVSRTRLLGPNHAYYLLGGERAKHVLDEMKEWLRLHNNAVMAVLSIVFRVDLIAKGLPPLTSAMANPSREE